MRPAVLPVVTFGLFALVVADRVSHAFATASGKAVIQSPRDSLPAAVALGNRAAAGSARELNSSAGAAATLMEYPMNPE